MSEIIKENELDKSITLDSENLPSAEEQKITGRKKYIILCSVFGFLFVLGVTLIAISIWYKNNYFLEFKELLYVLTGPLEGTGGSMISDILWATVPYAVIATALYVAASIIFSNRKLIKKAVVLKWIRIGGSLLCACTLIFSLVFTAFAFRITTYSNAMRESTDIYENYYVDPATAK